MHASWILATCHEGEIEISPFRSEADARHALMRDIYEHYQEFNLPDEDSDEAISQFINENGINLLYKIERISL